MSPPARSAAARVFLVFSLGYFLSYLTRGGNLPLAPRLSQELSLSASQLGLLTSAYLMAFMLCQLPLGVLLDRFGPRRVQGWLLLLASIGALVFSQSDTFAGLFIGRLLLGIGTSGCLMAGLQAIVLWFAPERLPVLNGAIYAIGGLGSVATGIPAQWALQHLDWRSLFLIVAGMIFLASMLIWWAVPEHHPASEPQPGGSADAPDDSAAARPASPTAAAPKMTTLEVARGVLQVLRNRMFWRVAPLAMLSQGTYLAVQGLWAASWLRDVDELRIPQIASIISWVGWTMVIGAATSGWIARRLEYAGISLGVSGGWGMGLFIVAQILIVLQVPLPLSFLWGLYGLAGTAGILSYAILTRSFGTALAGRASTALNLLVFCGAFLLQYGIGLILDAWPHDAIHYSPTAHKVSWLVMIVLQIVALAWYLVPIRTNRPLV